MTVAALHKALYVYMADPDGAPYPSHQSYRQSHTYRPQTCHAPSFGQQYPHQVSSDLRQHPDKSMASSRINSSKRPTLAYHPSHLGHLLNFPSNGFCSERPNFQLSPCTSLLTTTSAPVGYDNYLDQPSFTPVQTAPSHSNSSRHYLPSVHSRVQSMGVASSRHPHSCLQSSTTLSPNNISRGSMYAGQSQDRTFLGLDINTMDLPSSSQNGYITHSSTYHHQGHPTALSSNSYLPSPPVSPVSPVSTPSSLSPLISNFSKSRSSPSPPTSTPSSISTPATRPRVRKIESAFYLPPSLIYPTSSARPFGCESCKLSFVRHHDLKRHKETHTGSRPHMCSACGKSYTRKDALARHQLIKQCGKDSSRKKNDD